ncbi:GNAT family N-acetyltransferase [Lacticaseibacillus baoqingensis]|uniref:GNAT family N-acetyltransferase n=1 Tax=Lacticaseibacillus baoqingensis TaxID=2486013 RepID=A0ABW4E481_9LACO|nr:GNAT family N-acetyltransferase [Lacticaseibacillus baoqingensis]
MEIKTTTHLDSATYQDALTIRQNVFVREQGVDPALEVDANEDKATYFVAYEAGLAVGCARLLPEPYGYHVQRVAVEKAFRHRGVGKALMEAMRVFAEEVGVHELRLGAQVQALGFYKALGYTPTAKPEFTEAGIQHREMHLPLA